MKDIETSSVDAAAASDELKPWVKPELTVVTLKDAMTNFGGSGGDGSFNYS